LGTGAWSSYYPSFGTGYGSNMTLVEKVREIGREEMVGSKGAATQTFVLTHAFVVVVLEPFAPPLPQRQPRTRVLLLQQYPVEARFGCDAVFQCELCRCGHGEHERGL